jgi:hypothetical protein
LDVTDSSSKVLRTTCQKVYKKAHGAIFFLMNKTELPDTVETMCFATWNSTMTTMTTTTQSATTATTTTATAAASATTAVVLTASAELLRPRLCLIPSLVSLCRAATPPLTSPIRFGSPPRVTANPPVDTANRLAETTANHLADTTANRLVNTTAYTPADTTDEPALKKQHLVTNPETNDALWLFGGDDALSNGEFRTVFNCAPHGDGMAFNAIDLDGDIIAFVPSVEGKFVIGKTCTALVDLGERGHTSYQVAKHTAAVGALLANRVPGQLSGGYDHGSFNRLRTKITSCIAD